MMKLFSKNKSKDSTGTAPASSSSKESNGCYNIKEKSLDKIYRAAWNGDIKKLNTFQNDVNVPDSEKRTALHLACANGQERAVDVLLSMGADATVVDKENRTPLYRAVQTNRALCIRVLLKKVPNLAKDESSISLLHMAVQNGSSESLAALLSSMSDAVDTTDSNGRTALMLACESGRTSMVAALLDKGASLAATDAAGRSCSDYAKPHPDCLKIIESRRSGRPSVSNPNTPRGNRTSSDFEEDESKSTDFDIPVMAGQEKQRKSKAAAEPENSSNQVVYRLQQLSFFEFLLLFFHAEMLCNTRVAGRSRSPVVALVGGRRAISLNVLPPGESSVQVFDPGEPFYMSPAVSPTASIESLGSDDEAARLAAGSVAGEANKSSARAEAPPMRKSLAAVPEAATATTKNSAAMTPPAPSQPAAAASVGGGGGNESDSDWSNSQSASAAAPETGGKSLGAKINLKLELEKRMAGTAAAAGSVGSAKNNIADDVEDIVEIGDAEDDDDDNTVASEFPPTTAPTPRSVGNAATPRDGFQRQDSDWEASEISEAPPPQPKLKRESTEQVTAAKADDEESDWDESVAVSAAAKGPDEVKAQPASAKLSAAPEDESDWDNSMTEAPSIAAAAAVPQPSNSKPLPATVNLGESANSVARDEISEWDSATEDVPSSAATEAPSPRKQQQEQPPDSARNQGSLQPIAEEAAVVAAAIAADLNQPPAAAVSVDVAKKADGLEFWDSEASLAASDGPPSNRSEPSAASGVEKPLAAAAKDKLETQAQGDTDTDEDIDFARDGGATSLSNSLAGTKRPKMMECRKSASPQEAGEKLNADDEESPKRSIEEFPAAAADAAASATGTLSRKPSSPRAPSPKPMTSSVAVATSACPSPVREDPEALARLQAELATAVDNLAESRAESARLSEELELATNKLSEARRLQADAEAELATARRRLEAEQA
uniref:ANK_REP_REGION domain-containing protein n=1 Tax=Macrostomum lignano TaxID=282301 RepID=A0A1I8H748_9PLAT